MFLTDSLIRKAKPAAKPYKLRRENGLYVQVNPTGSKWWRWSYSFEGREKLLSLGVYPEVSLAMARQRAARERELLATGVDPSAAKKAAKALKNTESANTFRRVADEWMARKGSDISAGTLRKARWMLETFAYPKIGAMPLTSIQPPDILAVLRAVERDGKLETMHRLKGRISEVFRYAISFGGAISDPTRDLRGAVRPKRPVKHHAALTDPQAIGELLRAMDGYQGTQEARAALRLAALLFVRPGELRHAQWPQFDLDGPAPSWRYIATKTKTDHIVPLAVQAVAILRELQPLTHRVSQAHADLPCYVFPGARSRARPMSENTVNAALRRLGYTGDEMTGHGFRAMARTLLAEMGWKPEAIERQLAHKASGPLGAAYDRAQYLAERRAMMQAWADYLDRLRQGDSKVVALRSGVA